MSTIYIQEPSTKGKVNIITSTGEIEVELWPKEAPKACRNFVQLCLEGYYNNTVFHRVVPMFIVQGGDPTGTGEGGDSVYEEDFGLEIHSRLRFNRRGLLAMASNDEGKNGSQFFITLAATPELQTKHTIFGTVVGDTIFNVLKLAEGEVDTATERPLYPKKITRTDVINNPFEDIVPRITAKDREAMKSRKNEGTKHGSRHVDSRFKNKRMLTFDDPSEDEGEVFKVKSIYDLNDKGILPTTSKGRRKSKKKDEDGSNKAVKLDKDSHIPSLASNSLSSAPTRKLGDNNDISNAGLDPQLESMIENPVNTNEDLLNNTSQSTIKPAIQEEPHTRVTTDIDANSNANSNTNPSKKSSKVHPDDKHVKSSSISSELEKYKKKAQLPKKSNSDYQTKLFQKLSFFKSKLQSKDAAIGDSEPKRQTPTEHSACKLHGISNCGSCNKHVAVGEELPDTTGSNWMNHTLDFGASNPKKEKSSYAPKVEDYVVIDPREKEKLYSKNKTSKS